MSHETGIQANDDLKERLNERRDNKNVRVIKIKIENEQLVFIGESSAQSTFKEDFSQLRELVTEAEPCYLLIRTDSSNTYGFQWILITFVPTASKTREKMLYSSTKAAMKREFGLNQLEAEYFANEMPDLTFESYTSYQDRSEKPYTEQEIELEEVRKQERQTMRGLGERVKLASSIDFPPTEEAFEVISNFAGGKISFAQFVINSEKEVIECTLSKTSMPPEGFDAVVPRDRATYNLYRVAVMAADGYVNDNPVLFIHAISNTSSVKEKMLFSSCKSPFLYLLTRAEVGIVIDRKVELDILDESITPEFILAEVEVKDLSLKKKFDKPKLPGRRPITAPRP